MGEGRGRGGAGRRKLEMGGVEGGKLQSIERENFRDVGCGGTG